MIINNLQVVKSILESIIKYANMEDSPLQIDTINSLSMILEERKGIIDTENRATVDDFYYCHVKLLKLYSNYSMKAERKLLAVWVDSDNIRDVMVLYPELINHESFIYDFNKFLGYLEHYLEQKEKELPF